MPIAYRYMLTVHLIKIFQNKRTRNSYTIYLFKLKDNIFRIIITIEAKKLHSVFSISNDSFRHTFECTHVYAGTCRYTIIILQIVSVSTALWYLQITIYIYITHIYEYVLYNTVLSVRSSRPRALTFVYCFYCHCSVNCVSFLIFV